MTVYEMLWHEKDFTAHGGYELRFAGSPSDCAADPPKRRAMGTSLKSCASDMFGNALWSSVDTRGEYCVNGGPRTSKDLEELLSQYFNPSPDDQQAVLQRPLHECQARPFPTLGIVILHE